MYPAHQTSTNFRICYLIVTMTPLAIRWWSEVAKRKLEMSDNINREGEWENYCWKFTSEFTTICTTLTYGNESFSLRNWGTLIIYLTMSDKKWNCFSLSSEKCFNIFRSEFINASKKKFVGRKGKDRHAKNAWNFTVKWLVIKKLGYQGIAITYELLSPFFPLTSSIPGIQGFTFSSDWSD